MVSGTCRRGRTLLLPPRWKWRSVRLKEARWGSMIQSGRDRPSMAQQARTSSSAATAAMDQMISASGKKPFPAALAGDSPIPMPADLAVDRQCAPRSGGQRIQHPSPAVRRGRPSLRGPRRCATRSGGLEAGKAGLDEACYRRARHIVGGKRHLWRPPMRWRATIWTRLGELMAESRAAMRDDFEITSARHRLVCADHQGQDRHRWRRG